jgi:hypothetical protein
MQEINYNDGITGSREEQEEPQLYGGRNCDRGNEDEDMSRCS